jgi:ribosome-associated protein
MSEAQRLDSAAWVAEAALGKKAERLVALDVRGLTSIADVFVIATATSDRHARAIADAISEEASRRGRRVLGVEGYEDARWLLIDLDDVIVHVFLPDVREAYDLERLWSDAPALAVDEAGAAH